MYKMNYESYPPPFRQENNHIQNIDTDETTNQVLDLDPIPLIDLQCLDLDQLGEACRDWGIFRLVNHGIPDTLLSQLQDQAKKLFYLSFESKQALFTGPVSYFWGTPALSPSGSALLPLSSAPQNINWVEGFNVRLGQLSPFQAEEPMLDSFRLLMEEYGMHLSITVSTIFKATAKNLNLDPQKSVSILSKSSGFIRAYRYPFCSKDNDTWGLNVHTDSSLFSVLYQDHIGGLEVFKDGKWLDVNPIPNSLIVNIGDMMQAISDDEYISVRHRVKVKKQERFSICYFVFPDEDCVIQSSKYKPFTYGDFRAQVQHDIKSLGLKVGLERFKVDH
ncbi:2OG-FeII_Oxy domain-containing protein/DIOX_N domain-containing protein [Cephalotus follicularis]|uniref:2OG-FeII_Oxy domain-containing protein/DIOX_N domain-containing protein n=1 Tax=Cephalotus follicularis TaxID=3775 RepID=A0A1Q3BF75_CEPFO|nr:2OG-FeII_Oxy domain-containing protein/DIOX_N domain-containing protein [Cephalotus follicularis]